MGGILFQCVCTKSHHNLHFKYLTVLLVHYISIKLEKKKKKPLLILKETTTDHSKLFILCVLSSLFICVCTGVFSLWQNTRNTKFTVFLLFKHRDSVSLSMLTLLCNRPHHPSRELSHLPKLKLCAGETLSLHPLPHPGPHHLLPVSIDLTPPGNSCKWNQTVSVL